MLPDSPKKMLLAAELFPTVTVPVPPLKSTIIGPVTEPAGPFILRVPEFKLMAFPLPRLIVPVTFTTPVLLPLIANPAVQSGFRDSARDIDGCPNRGVVG